MSKHQRAELAYALVAVALIGEVASYGLKIFLILILFVALWAFVHAD